jgi:hypothetical protein
LHRSVLSADTANFRGSFQSAHRRVAQPSFFANNPHGLSFGLRAYHFFDSTTFSASMSNACWATIFFNRESRPPANASDAFR